MTAGSRSAVGELDDEVIGAAKDRTNGTRLRNALAAAGFAGKPRHVIDPKRYVGFLEAHIEQGDWLIANDLTIGIVTTIVGIRQYKITFEGFQNHAGTTRMAVRRDAGVALVRLAAAVDEMFPALAAKGTVWTVGRIDLVPGAPSVIPGNAEMVLQMRDPDNAVLDRLEHGKGNAEDLELLLSLADRISGKVLCALGDFATSPVVATIKHFRAEYLAHVELGRCPKPEWC